MSSRKPLVYIAAAYRRPEPVVNTATAVAKGREIRDDLDVCVIIPHLSLFEHFQKPGSDAYWLRVTLDLMRRCDAVYRIHGFSEGSDAEVAEARRLGIPVFHDLASLAVWVGAWEQQHGLSDGRGNQQGTADAQGIEDAERR